MRFAREGCCSRDCVHYVIAFVSSRFALVFVLRASEMVLAGIRGWTACT